MRSRLLIRGRSAATTPLVAAGLAAAFLFLSPRPAGAQTVPAAGAQSVGISPTESHPNDPNGGQWFVFQLAPGQSGSTRARIANPSSEAQTVQLSLRDLSFSPNGTPELNDGAQQDVGAWGAFDQPSVTIPAKSQVFVPFHLTVPAGADPGDHAGVVMAVSAPSTTAGNFNVITRVAVRLYVTVPGDATKAFEVTSVTGKPDAPLLPGNEVVKVRLHNTGRIRLHPVVLVGGHRATGSDTLLATSYEDYIAKVPVKPWGGPVNEKVVVTTDAGLTRVIAHSQFVIPWALISTALLAGFVLLGLYLLVRRRQRKLAALQADLRRLEQLVTQRAAPAALAGAGEVVEAVETSAEIQALETAIKRARRTGHPETLPELALALHRAGGDALDVLLETLASTGTGDGAGRQAELVDAARRYPRERVEGSHRLRALPAELAATLTAPPVPSKRAPRSPGRGHAAAEARVPAGSRASQS